MTTVASRPSAEDRIRAALWFAEHGFGVFSVWSVEPDGTCRCPKGVRCDNPGKHPIGRQGFHEHTRDPERIRTLLSAASEPNYGLVCPEGVFALDVDGEGLAHLADLEQRLGALPPTLRTRTAHGEHVFLRWPASLPRPIGRLFGFVTRWGSGRDAGYVIGPRSVHASGAVYAPSEGSAFEIAELPEAWAREALDEPQTTITIASGFALPDRVPAGVSRYEVIRAYTAHLYNRGLTREEMWPLVRDILAPRFAAPLTEPELRSRFERTIDKLPQRLGPPRMPPQQAAAAEPVDPSTFPLPEDRGLAAISDLGDVEYVDDLVRPGRIVVWAAEEGSGKSFAVSGELAIRVARAGGSFAGTWEILERGPVLVLSEMHPDDDFVREATVLDSLGLARSELRDSYFRLGLMTAAGGKPALMVPEWREWITAWLQDAEALLLVVDTATGATQVDPWGREIQGVYAALRMMLEAYPRLAIVLIVHVRKPTGGKREGHRELSDVLGEWGRWCDVVVLQENDGTSLERTKLTTRKRVRRQRRVVATKRGGLLVDPIEIEGGVTKVPETEILAAIAKHPGATYAELARIWGVAPQTARRYVELLGERAIRVPAGPRGRIAVYDPDSAPRDLLTPQHEADVEVGERETGTATHRNTEPVEVEADSGPNPPHHRNTPQHGPRVEVVSGGVGPQRGTTPPIGGGGVVVPRCGPPTPGAQHEGGVAVPPAEGAPALRPDGSVWCAYFADHMSAHRDVSSEPWCRICTPREEEDA